MGQAVISFLNTETTVPRDSEYNLHFEIIHPTMETNVTNSLLMSHEGALDIGNLYSIDIDKENEWVFIDSISQNTVGNDEYMTIVGLKRLSYRYKVEIVETNTVLKPFTDYILDANIVDTSINITKDMFMTWNPYHIKVTVEQSDGIIVENSWQIHVYDTQPILSIVNVENNVLGFQIGDLESDDVKYRIKLNGSQIYPPNTTDMTTLQSTPISGNILLPKDKIIPESSNTVVIEAEDSWGMFISFPPTTFIGTYQGLMFVDELDNVYTTDIGIIKDLIEFNLIQAGQESLVKTIYLKNLTGYNIKDLIITLDTSVLINGNTGNNTDVNSIPQNTYMWIAKDSSSFVEGNNQIIFSETIFSGQKVPFVIKVTTDIFSSGVGQFGLYAVATPV